MRGALLAGPVAGLRFWTAVSAARGAHAHRNTSAGRPHAHACGAHGEHALLRAGRLLAGRRRTRSGRGRFSRPSGPPRARRIGPGEGRDLRLRAGEGRPPSARSNNLERDGAWGARGWRAATAACAPRRGARAPRRSHHRALDGAQVRAGGGARPRRVRRAEAVEVGAQRLSLGCAALEPKARPGAKPERFATRLRRRTPLPDAFSRRRLSAIRQGQAPEHSPIKA